MQGVDAASAVEAKEDSIVHRDILRVRETYTSVITVGRRLTTIEAQ